MSTAHGAITRALAAGVIAAVRFDGRSLKATLPDALARLPDARDRALCEAIAFEAIRWLPRYEFWLRRLLDKPLPASANNMASNSMRLRDSRFRAKPMTNCGKADVRRCLRHHRSIIGRT